MTVRYHCPACSGLLNPGTKVIFVVEQGANRGLMLLNPKLGDYAAVLSESFPLEVGAACGFHCPICHADLTSPHDPNLVEIHVRAADGSTGRVSFSRIFGEHATFLVTQAGVRRFGEHAARYETVNFFGAGDVEAGD